MAVDVVYPLGKGSIYNNFELRMSLRSIEKNISGVGNIYIVGEKPHWIKNVVHLQADDLYRIPDRNIMHKVNIACKNPSVSDEFLFLNDDHFILRPFRAPDFPFFYSESMSEHVRRRRGDGYGIRVKNSLEYLNARKLPSKYYDTHTPILYKKKAFIEHVVEKLDWNIPHGYVLKSIYANSINVDGVQMDDKKGGEAPSKKVAIFSTKPYIRTALQRWLTEQFPTQSAFENDNPGY